MPAEFDANQKLNRPQAASPAVSSPSENDDELMWELLSLYADGEASPEESAQVEQMLRHDGEYARAYAFMQKAGSTIRTIVEIEPPTHLRDAILAKTTHRPTFARRAAIVFGTFRAQLVAPMGRLAFAGGGLAAVALVIGIYAGRTNSFDSLSVNLPATGMVARTISPVTRPEKSSVASPAVKTSIPVIAIPNAEEFVAASASSPAGSAKPESTGNTVAAAKPNVQSASSVVPMGPRLAAGPTVTQMPAITTPKQKSAPVQPNRAGRFIAVNFTNPSRPAEMRKTDDTGGTQNVLPMMDANVQHRTAPMVIASINPGVGGAGTKSMNADMDDLNDNNVLVVHDTSTSSSSNTTDGDSSSEGGRKIVGRLMLSKLPPSSRHLMSPADAIREANNRSLISYSAASSEETPRRAADVPVLKGSF